MKKILTPFIIIVIIHSTSFAQITKGTLLLGGGIGVGTSNSKTDNSNFETKNNYFSINPVVGFTVKENVIVGGDVLYSFSKNSNQPDYSQKNTNLGAGVFVRKYIPITNKFYFFGQGRLGAGYFESKIQNGIDFSSKVKGWGTDIGIVPGISVAVNKKFHLEAGLNSVANISFQHGKREDMSIAGKVTSTSNSFSFTSSLSTVSSSLFFGFRFLLQN
jgi:Outer membrane protein beta-barrel domain